MSFWVDFVIQLLGIRLGREDSDFIVDVLFAATICVMWIMTFSLISSKLINAKEMTFGVLCLYVGGLISSAGAALVTIYISVRKQDKSSEKLLLQLCFMGGAGIFLARLMQSWADMLKKVSPWWLLSSQNTGMQDTLPITQKKT